LTQTFAIGLSRGSGVVELSPSRQNILNTPAGAGKVYGGGQKFKEALVGTHDLFFIGRVLVVYVWIDNKVVLHWIKGDPDPVLVIPNTKAPAITDYFENNPKPTKVSMLLEIGIGVLPVVDIAVEPNRDVVQISDAIIEVVEPDVVDKIILGSRLDIDTPLIDIILSTPQQRAIIDEPNLTPQQRVIIDDPNLTPQQKDSSLAVLVLLGAMVLA